MRKLENWYARLPARFRRVMLVAGALAMFGIAAWTIYEREFGSVIQLIIGLVGTRLLLTRAFASWRLKGLTAAGKTLGIPVDEAGMLDGRLRGIRVRVVPIGSKQLKAIVNDGLGNTEIDKSIGDPFRPTTENKIVSAVELLVSKAEAAQAEICSRARTGIDPAARRDAVRALRVIAEEDRIPLVGETLAAAGTDADPRVRLAATFDGTPAVTEAEALVALSSGDDDSVTEAASALAAIGSANALVDLVAVRDRAPVAVEAALAAIRGRTGVQAGGLAVAESLDAGGAVSLATKAGSLTIKSSSS